MSLGYNNRLTAGITVIANEFIDRFMADASGEYVKVYLYLLRHEAEALTVEMIAEALHHTEADVRRALAYWEKAGVLFGAAEEVRSPEAGASSARAMDLSCPCDLSGLENDENFKQLIFITEQYLNKAGKMTATDCQILANLYLNLKMAPELLEYLIEYCAQTKHYSLRYAETVALSWHEKKISTVEEAKTYTRGFSKESFAVMKAMGLSGRSPADAEHELMEKWFRQYGFTREIVTEACSRTIRAIHTPSFPYADKILTEWKEAGVRTFRDIAALDKKRKEAAGGGTGTAVRGTGPAAGGVSGKRAAGGKKTSNRFHNLEEHGYDYDEMVWNMINPDPKTGGSDGAQ